MRKEFTIKINYLLRKPIMLVTALVALFGLQSFNSVEPTTDSVEVVSSQPIQDEVEVKKSHEMKFSWEISRVETPRIRTVKRRNSTKVCNSNLKEPKLENISTISSTTHPIYGELLIERLKTVDKKGNDVRETTKYNFSIENQPHYISMDKLTDQVFKRVEKEEANVERKRITSEEALSMLYTVLLDKINDLTVALAPVPNNPGSQEYYYLSGEQIEGIPDYISERKKRRNRPFSGSVIGMTVTENATLVDFVVSPSNDSFWWSLSQNTNLVDTKTGKKYKIIGIKRGIPLERLLVVEGMVHRDLCYTFIFPPLDPDVKKVHFIESANEFLVAPSDAAGCFGNANLKVKKLQRRRASN